MRKFIIPLFLLLVVAGVAVFWWQHGKQAQDPAPKIAHQSTHPAPKYVVSLGDSVAAGDGLQVTSSSSVASLCKQSEAAYSVQVAATKGLKLEQFACSGAKVTTGILQPQVVSNQTIPSQLTAAAPYLKYNDVLITIGANDVNWDNELYACVLSNCETTNDLHAFQLSLSELSTNLNTMLQEIANHHPNRVVLNTYYPLLNNTDTCLAGQGISTSKIVWVNNLEANLNTTITTAANKYHDQTVPIDFSGHLLCDAVPWLQGLSDPAPLHPPAAGQSRIAVQDSGLL